MTIASREPELGKKNMEECVWTKLPDDIVVEGIFRRLTVWDVLTLRCVCRRFKNMASSRRFLDLHPTCTSTRPNLLLLLPFHALGAERAFDPTLTAWFNPSLAFLLPTLQDSYYPVASCHGLVCLASGRDFVICNPITRLWRILPPLPPRVQSQDGQSFISVCFGEDYEQSYGLTVDDSAGSYRFAMMNVSTVNRTIQVMSFHSSTGDWHCSLEFATSKQLSLHKTSMVACKSNFYCLLRRGSRRIIFCIGAGGLCTEIEAPDCSSALVSCNLMDHHGHLYMVGGVGNLWLGNDAWERPTSIRIWELLDGKEWVEAVRLPFSLMQDFRQYIDFDELMCCGKDDLLYMKSPGSVVLLYDLGSRSWIWLDDESSDDLEIAALIWEPSISATV